MHNGMLSKVAEHMGRWQRAFRTQFHGAAKHGNCFVEAMAFTIGTSALVVLLGKKRKNPPPEVRADTWRERGEIEGRDNTYLPQRQKLTIVLEPGAGHGIEGRDESRNPLRSDCLEHEHGTPWAEGRLPLSYSVPPAYGVRRTNIEKACMGASYGAEIRDGGTHLAYSADPRRPTVPISQVRLQLQAHYTPPPL